MTTSQSTAPSEPDAQLIGDLIADMESVEIERSVIMRLKDPATIHSLRRLMAKATFTDKELDSLALALFAASPVLPGRRYWRRRLAQ